jgi:hypothetical protein
MNLTQAHCGQDFVNIFRNKSRREKYIAGIGVELFTARIIREAVNSNTL